MKNYGLTLVGITLATLGLFGCPPEDKKDTNGEGSSSSGDNASGGTTSSSGENGSSSGVLSSSGGSSGENGSSSGDLSSSSGGASSSGGPLAEGWTVRSNDATDAGGNRTDALWVDADGTVWTGYGTTTEGYGLFKGTGLGTSWSKVNDPDGVLAGNTFRVHSIFRAADDLLYLGAPIDGYKALALNTTTLEVTGAMDSVNTVGLSFEPGSFLVTPAGAVLAHSRTGAGLLVRESGTSTNPSDWTDLYDTGTFVTATTYDGKFYGAGVTTNKRRIAFVPRPNGGVADFTEVQLGIGLGQEAELNGIAVGEKKAVIVGFNQSNYTGIYWIASTNKVAVEAAWTRGNFSAVFGDATARTWARGACVDGDKIAIVGEDPQESKAKVALSLDGGTTFTAISPEDTGPVHKCQFAADGTLVVAGAGGFVGLYR